MPYIFVMIAAVLGQLPDDVDPWDVDNTKNIPITLGGSPVPQPL